MRARYGFAILTIAIIIMTIAVVAEASPIPLSSKITQGELRIMDKDGVAVGQCPLKHTTVTGDVSGFVARVYVTQEFTNPMSEKIEAVYVFPLPQDAAVDQMEMTVGERTITGVIKKREEARQIYETAKQAGHVASLLDQERPNIFTQSVANIMPGETVKITISYVDLLKYEDGRYEFVFPMVVGPRYMPGTPTGQTGTGRDPDTNVVLDASKISPPITPEGTRTGHDISIDLQINAGVPVDKMDSVLHEVNIVPMGGNVMQVTLRDEATIPNKDFILRYQVAGDQVRTGLLPNTRSAGDGYFSLVLVPPKVPTAAQIAPKEMIFVIDSSGSQQGWPIEKAKETMKLCVEQMNPGDTFQMLAFSNDVISLFDKPQPNTAENRAKAQEFLANRLGNGGTEMLKAVKAALDPPADPARLRIVCFMTDGFVGNDFQILGEIQKSVGGARLFPFGIGNSVNRFLLDGMAATGRGAVEYVTLAEQGSLSAKRFQERISKPVLTDITIDWNGLPVADVYPEVIPDLFSTKPVILKGRYTAAAGGVMTIHGRLGGKKWQQRIDVVLPAEQDENGALPSLWARARIADLTAVDYSGAQNNLVDDKLREAITEVALDYQLMSQYTSFVAVEETTVTEGGTPKKVAVPVEMPEGVSYEGTFGEKGSGVINEIKKTPSVVGSAGSVSLGAGYSYSQRRKADSPTVSAPAATPTDADGRPSSNANGYSADRLHLDSTGRAADMKPDIGIMDRSATGIATWSSPGPAGPAGEPDSSIIVRGTEDGVALFDDEKGDVSSRGTHTSGTVVGNGHLRAGAADASVAASTFSGKDFNRNRISTTPDRFGVSTAGGWQILSLRLDPLLQNLSKKLDKNGNFRVQGQVEARNGFVRVSIRLSDDSETNLAKLRTLGVQFSGPAKWLKMVVGWAPVAKLDELAQLDFVKKIAPVM